MKKSELPSTLKRSPAKAQRTFVKTDDSAVEEYGEGERAHRTAYASRIRGATAVRRRVLPVVQLGCAPDGDRPVCPGRSCMASRPAACGAVLAILLTAAPSAAAANGPHRAAVARMRAFMRDLRAESRIDARRIADAYRDARGEMPDDLWALARAWRAGRIAAAPAGERFNVLLRVTGSHPIGENDLRHQRLYLGARPATLGLLLHVASRVSSGPLEVTSLVRHEAYQRELQRTNPNARTPVPTHALGVAFDVSILHASEATATELRDVLRYMRDHGDLWFIAESRQLVFHVVLRPERAPFYHAVFEAVIAAPARLETVPRRSTRRQVDALRRQAQREGADGQVAAALVSGSRLFAYFVVPAVISLRPLRGRRWRMRRPDAE